MDEIERYECFAVPPHAWTVPAELAALVMPARQPRRAVPIDLELLGVEALPSPSLAEFALHG